MKTIMLIVSIGMIIINDGLCQKEGKSSRYFDEPILTDTLSTIFFPTRYNEKFFSSNKIAIFGNYYANIVVYDFKTDSYHKLFPTDTYIEAFKKISYSRNNTGNDTGLKNLTKNWVFLLVRNKDSNNNGRIDENDPSILFVTTTKGDNLKQLTDEGESVIDLDIFEDQGFGIIKIQKEFNKDKAFTYDERSFYFKKINLSDLTLGKGIEIK